MKIGIATVNWQCSDIANELLIKSANEIGDKIQTIFVSIKIADNQTIEVSVLFNRRHQIHCRKMVNRRRACLGKFKVNTSCVMWVG